MGISKELEAKLKGKEMWMTFLSCDFVIGDIIPCEYGFQHKDGSLALLTEEEMKQYLQYRKEEDESAVFISTILN